MLIPIPDLDAVLTLQLAVAWAGERSAEPERLGWWNTDLASEFGGEDLFRRMFPETAVWAALQSAREAARRVDAWGRARDADPDRLYTLFRFGFEIDEQLDDRLQQLKHEQPDPLVALPGLASVVTRDAWSSADFDAWCDGQGTVTFQKAPTGRRVTGASDAPARRARQLVAALRPLTDDYPLPHHRKDA